MTRFVWMAAILIELPGFAWGGTPVESGVITVCQDEEQQREYAGLVAALVRAVEKADDPSDVATWKQLWRQILEHPCMALSRRESLGSLPDPDNVRVFTDWMSSGGEYWLSSAPDDDRVVLPPEPKKKPDSVLLCEDALDAACGRDTKAWMNRAGLALRRKSLEEGWAIPNDHLDEWHTATTSACQTEAEKDHDDPYGAWVACLESKRTQSAVMPAGRTRAPDQGWFIVQGRRGHYQFCDEVRLYDLATGAAYIAQSCSGLVLTEGGGVHFGATDARRRVRVEVGRVEPWALREAVWMAVLAPGVQTLHADAELFSVPQGMVRRLSANGGRMHGLSLGGFWATSAQTLLTWKWQRPGSDTVSGELVWPDSADPGTNYAVELLRIAEQTFVPGCAPARLDRSFYVSPGKPGVSGLDANPRALLDVQQGLLDALRDVEQPPHCP